MFHYWLIIVGGFANASDAIEILCVSLLMPAAECDLHMSSAEKGWLSAMVFVGRLSSISIGTSYSIMCLITM